MAQLESPKNITVQRNMISSKNILDMEYTVIVTQLQCLFSNSVKEAPYAHKSCTFNLEKMYCFTLKQEMLRVTDFYLHCSSSAALF